MPKIFPFIMSGGSGTRLWPLSRATMPKQHLTLTGDESLLAQTIKRVTAAPDDLDVAAPTIICSARHEDNVSALLQQPGLESCDMVIEPVGRNTAPVAAIAALEALKRDPDGLVLLLPADHFIADANGFWNSVTTGIAAAKDSHLVTLGIKPTGPETGYGYIKQSDAMGENLHRIEAFVEKPDLETAERYLAEGGYYWNAGIFLFGGQAMVDEFDQHAPEILAAVRATLDKSPRRDKVLALDEATFANCPSDSVDFAIMEMTSRAALVAPVEIGWNDIGTWKSLMEVSAALDGGNASDNVLMIDSDNTYVKSDGVFVATIGVSDLIVVTTNDAVLVTHKERSQDLRRVIEHLKKSGRSELL